MVKIEFLLPQTYCLEVFKVVFFDFFEEIDFIQNIYLHYLGIDVLSVALVVNFDLPFVKSSNGLFSFTFLPISFHLFFV